jgi:hypothetical protein
MAATEAAAIQVSRFRESATETVPLPPSLQALLCYDQDLMLRAGHAFFEHLFASLDGQVVQSQTINEVLKHRFGAAFNKDGSMSWTDGPDMPALLEFPHSGDQRVFMYIGIPDDEGEYPMVRFDDQPEVWMTAGLLLDELLAELPGASARKAEAKRRNQRSLKREWFAKPS